MAEHKVYVAVPRKWIVAWITSVIVFFAGIIGSYQYTYRLSQQLCGIIVISNNTYQANMQYQITETGRAMAKEFQRLVRKYHC